MSEEGKGSSDWDEHELELAVADYFDMLAADLTRKPYSKSEHNAALGARIKRSRGSIEFKHQNISAVLQELGMPWIPGYKPRRNYQAAIMVAIDRFLSANPSVFENVPTDAPVVADPSELFVNAPEPRILEPSPEPLRHLLRKFDPVQRDHLNRKLGKSGEAFVLNVERMRLEGLARHDLAAKVRWVSQEEGDAAGYDILSFDPVAGRERLIEVKTTNGTARTPFFLSRNEAYVANERPLEWKIYRVHLFARSARIFTIAPPLENALHLTPETWRASF